VRKIIAKEVKEGVSAKVKASGRCILICQTVWGIRQDNLQLVEGGVVNVVNQVAGLEHIRLKKENQQLKEIIGVLTYIWD
jgi:hypothetical protein